MRARDQSSIFSTGGKFCPDYGLLLELQALTLVARSYVLLSHVYQWIQNPNLCKVATAGMKREKKSHDCHSDNVLYCRAAIKVEITEPRH